MEELFSNSPKSVHSTRFLYTASLFARTSLLYLQEIGQLTALKAHTSKRTGLSSYLCFYVENGSGVLQYNGTSYAVHSGDVVFIDCTKSYAHNTSENDLWTLRWCHFNGAFMPDIYKKYLERGGQPVFQSTKRFKYCNILEDLLLLMEKQDHVRDMKINMLLSELLVYLMEDSWNPDKAQLISPKRMELSSVKQYLDEHYTEKITLDQLSAQFYINKQYLSKIFHEAYGMTIITYINQQKITHAKQLLRFTDMSLDEIAAKVGMTDANYFSRTFYKVQGVRPKDFRKMW